MQKILQRIINEISVIWLLLLVGSIFYIWTAGLSDSTALFLYENSAEVVLVGTMVLFVLNMYKARGFDFFYLGVSVVVYLFFMHFREVRAASFYTDILIPLIVAFILCIKWIEFGNVERIIFLLFFALLLSITVYRIFTEITIPEGQSIWSPNNSLSDIWINTNTIGSSVLTLTLLITSFAKSFEKWYIRFFALPAIIAGLAAIWVCQSRGAFFALIVFVILDLIPKSFLRMIRGPFFAYLMVALTALPITYYSAVSEKINLFTGREEIWKDFYQTLTAKTQQVWIGMEPFYYTKRANQVLGNHNSYNSFLNLYGVIGFLTVAILLLIFIGHKTLRADITNGQLTFLYAFFSILVQSFMEDTLTSFAWLPIIYFLLGMSTQRFDKHDGDKKQIETHQLTEDSFEIDKEEFSRITRYHN